MSDTNSGFTYTVEESEGAWFQLWYDGEGCVYSEELDAQSREEAEKQAAEIAASSSPVERVMKALGASLERRGGSVTAEPVGASKGRIRKRP